MAIWNNLPLDIVVHIQRFMNFRDAARSATICTRLFTSWFDLENIDFDERVFENRDLFWVGAHRTIRRYEWGRLRMRKVTLRVASCSERYITSTFVIQSAVAIGATDIDLIIYNAKFMCCLPPNVFKSRHVESLSVVGGTMHSSLSIPVCNSSLKRLLLEPVHFSGSNNNFLYHLVMRFPSLEHLACNNLLLWTPQCFHVNLYHNLTSLVVKGLELTNLMAFSHIIGIFLKLQKLCILHIETCHDMVLSSDSIEELIIENPIHYIYVEARLPRLRLFSFMGDARSRLQFVKPQHEWVSHIRIINECHCPRLLSDLHATLEQFSRSTLHISVLLTYDHPNCGLESVGIKQKIIVDKLDVISVKPVPQCVEGILTILCPTTIKCIDRSGYGFLASDRCFTSYINGMISRITSL